MSEPTLRATGAAAVSMAIAPGVPWELEEVRIHLSAAGGAGNLTITETCAVSAVYSTVILTQDMTSVTDLVWQPTRPLSFDTGDSVTLAWANASTRTYGIQVKFAAA